MGSAPSDLMANSIPDAKPFRDGAKKESLPIILRIKMAVLHTSALSGFSWFLFNSIAIHWYSTVKKA
jgi:hypothetical protein